MIAVNSELVGLPSISNPHQSTSSTAPPLPTAAATATALAIPEILLLILSHFQVNFVDYDGHIDSLTQMRFLAGCLRVASAWRGSAQAILYGKLDLVWSYTKAEKFRKCMEMNPSRYELVHSLKVRGYDQDYLRKYHEDETDWDAFMRAEGWDWDSENVDEVVDVFEATEEIRKDKLRELVDQDVDQKWVRSGAFESFEALVDFLSRLPNLRHLQLFNIEQQLVMMSLLTFSPTMSLLTFTPTTSLSFFQYLHTLKLEKPQGYLTQEILRSSSNIHTLDLIDPCVSFYIPPLPALQHLIFTYGPENDLSNNLHQFQNTLTTLSIQTAPSREHFLPFPRFHLHHLTHLHLSLFPDLVNPLEVASSIFQATPNIHFLALTFPGVRADEHSVLHGILPMLPPRITTFEALMVFYGGPELFKPESLTSILRKLSGEVKRVYFHLPGVKFDFEEMIGKESEKGIKLEIETGSQTEIWSSENWRRRMMENWRAEQVHAAS